MIHFQQRPVAELKHSKKYGFIVTNPPYGERLEDKADLPNCTDRLARHTADWTRGSMYLITSYEDAERYIGRKADKNRKIYNGMIKTYFYQFMGPKPPKRGKHTRRALTGNRGCEGEIDGLFQKIYCLWRNIGSCSIDKI